MSAVRPLPKPPTNLAERFWSVARGMEEDAGSSEPGAVVRHVLAVLDAFEDGDVGDGVTVHTLSFLHLLRQQEAKGDFLYASPEQARGEGIDERSLVFSVGVLLFERLTGRHPFGSEGNPSRVARIRKGELASGVNYFPKVPTELRNILVRAMGPFPEERFASLGELRASLEAYLARVDRSVKPPHPLPGMDPQGRARRAPPLKLAPREAALAPSLKGSERSERSGEVLLDRPSRLAPALWMLAGAAVASLAFFAISGSGGSVESAGEAHRASVAPMAPEEAAPDEAVKEKAPTTKKDKDTEAAPATETDTVTKTDRATEAAAAADTEAEAFDPDAAGKRLLRAARGCFEAARLEEGVRFGVSLIFTPGAPVSRRAFFGAGLQGGEQACLVEELVGLSAGAAPEARTSVQYDVSLGAEDGRFDSRVR